MVLAERPQKLLTLLSPLLQVVREDLPGRSEDTQTEEVAGTMPTLGMDFTVVEAAAPVLLLAMTQRALDI